MRPSGQVIVRRASGGRSDGLEETEIERTKYVYSFGAGGAEGSGELKELLGGKGAGLAEMSRLGIPVPPGFTLTTEACNEFHRARGRWPAGLEEQVDEHLARLETLQDQRFGDERRPLLVSVRSGALFSMPGMMDTVLNLGLSRRIVEAHRDAEDARFLRDSYRRLLAMFGDVVLGLPGSELDRVVPQVRAERGIAADQPIPLDDLERIIEGLEAIYARHRVELPQDPRRQLRAAIDAVFSSWNNRRAREYRRLHGIADDLGTGATVQAMVFGNRGPDCATGVAFTRNPATGEPELYGEYLINAQGEDIVAGTHTPQPLGSGDGNGLADRFPDAYEELAGVCRTLERHFHNMQDLEFTIQHGRLFMLQTRAGKRSGPAAVRIAVDMVEERLIKRDEALRRVEPQHLEQMMAPVFDPGERNMAIDGGRLVARGLPAGPGAASGRIAFTAEKATAMAQTGPTLLVRDETSPEDIVGMHASVGIITTRGGMTSHAAVVARGLGKPCIVGADDLQVDEEAGVLRLGERSWAEGEELSIDGTSGEVIDGSLTTRPSEVLQALLGADGGADARSPTVLAFERLLRWADRERRLGVRANADTPEDAIVARTFGAEGIGLCRTEHMFFHEERILWVRQVILAGSSEERARALERLLPVQQADFEGIFRALAGLPVTIRLLDPPLHEFLPTSRDALARLAREMGIEPEAVAAKAEALIEVNPMLGHRGCRLGITAPEIYDMQTEAIVRAACAVAADGVDVQPEIMVPLVGVEAEIAQLRRRIEAIIERITGEAGIDLQVHVGTMIEVPRAALTASAIARHADFFSFGTNDLTQMTYGYSRDDAGRFLPEYLEGGVIPFDPFARLDVEGVGQLVELACSRGRMANPSLKLGICGEHGGEPHSIAFFHRCGLDYVSCSPYRIPVARLAAARSALTAGAAGKLETYDK